MDKEILKIKQKLEKEREDIEKILKEIHNESEEYQQTDVLSDDEIADIYEKNKKIETLENDLKKRIAQLNKALEKIEKGIYGICESCGKKIEKEKLAIDLAALECSFCSKNN